VLDRQGKCKHTKAEGVKGNELADQQSVLGHVQLSMMMTADSMADSMAAYTRSARNTVHSAQ
jgi:hypothetical protein